MELYLFICNFKTFPYEECVNLLLVVNLFFNLRIDLILVDHQRESSNGQFFFVRVNLEQTFYFNTFFICCIFSSVVHRLY